MHALSYLHEIYLNCDSRNHIAFWSTSRKDIRCFSSEIPSDHFKTIPPVAGKCSCLARAVSLGDNRVLTRMFPVDRGGLQTATKFSPEDFKVFIGKRQILSNERSRFKVGSSLSLFLNVFESHDNLYRRKSQSLEENHAFSFIRPGWWKGFPSASICANVSQQ